MSREKVYDLLRSSEGEFLSGQQICEALGISRTAVWKAIQVLRQEGCRIEARKGLGYCLLEAPDTLSEREILRCMKSKRENSPIVCFDEIDSTNTYLKREEMRWAPSGTVAVANSQSAGRGRIDRVFQSPPGKGVYLSILLRPQLPLQEAIGVTGMAAVAAARAVERFTRRPVGIKWVNDLTMGNKKLGGILTEMGVEGESGRLRSLVIGVGVNVSQQKEDFTPDVAKIATSLAQEGLQVSRAALAAALIEELDLLARDLGREKRVWLEEYRRRSVNLGRDVRLLWTKEQKRARVLDIDEAFGLVVRMEDGTVTTLRAGDVSVRGLYGYTDL